MAVEPAGAGAVCVAVRRQQQQRGAGRQAERAVVAWRARRGSRAAPSICTSLARSSSSSVPSSTWVLFDAWTARHYGPCASKRLTWHAVTRRGRVGQILESLVHLLLCLRCRRAAIEAIVLAFLARFSGRATSLMAQVAGLAVRLAAANLLATCNRRGVWLGRPSLWLTQTCVWAAQLNWVQKLLAARRLEWRCEPSSGCQHACTTFWRLPRGGVTHSG